MRRESCFYYDGNIYYTGTKILITDGYPERQIEVTFKCRIVDTNNYMYTNVYGGDVIVSKERFFSRLIKVTEPKDLTTLVHEYEAAGAFDKIPAVKDSQIDGMAIGWMWYFFLMAISTIFHDRVGLWILISIVFFSWRASKRAKYNE